MELDERDRDLLRRSEELRREADAVVADLGLPGLFAAIGRSERVGSASFGLALSRDIDLDTLCPALDAGAVWDALRPLVDHPRVMKVRWTDVRGRFNDTGRPEADGLYCCIHYYAGAVRDELRWKIDCWFFPASSPRPDIALRDRVRAASPEERLAILRLKDAAMRAGRYGWAVDYQGHRIYEAVLDRGVRRLEDV
jgi:hypothetical protein